MSEKLTPFWEAGYQNMETLTFSAALSPTVTEFKPYLINHGIS